jgi:hypothetical protein
MKSAIFESINDRSNIANAYLKMVNEANETREQEIAEIERLFEDKECPLCIYDEKADPPSNVIDLFDIEQKYEEPSYYDRGTEEYYIALAFDNYSNEELYRKLLEKDSQYRLNPTELYMRNGDCEMTMGDLESDLEKIGRELEESWHSDDVEAAIPEWAAVYFVNDDDSGLTPEDKKMADDYLNNIESKGYTLVYDGENLGFCSNPEFGLADNCIKFYLVKSSEQNESVAKNKNITSDSLYNLLKPIDKNIASIVSYTFEHGKSLKDIISEIADMGIHGTSGSLSRTREIIKILHDTYGNDIIGESVDDGWFDSYGNMIKDLPEECINDCTVPGRDAYESCKYWVNELGFTNGLDIPLAKGYLKWTGGWDDDEIASLSDEETAIKILWILANDAKEGMDVLSIGDGGRFDDGSAAVTESRLRKRKVVLTNIKWPDGVDLPARGSMVVEVGEGESVEKAIGRYYTEINGVAPVKFHVARDIDLGFVEVDDDKKAKGGKKNEMVSQTDLDKLKKKNPKLKDISEER